MKTLWVKRTDHSSYFPADFMSLERHAFESIPGIGYCGVDQHVPATGPVCLLTNTHTQLSRWEGLKARVELVLHPNSGFDNLLPDLPSWSAPVLLGHPIRARAVADWILATLFQHFSPSQHSSAWPVSRQWERELLREQRILIVGLGHIGKLVNETLRTLGSKVECLDPWENFSADLSAPYDVVILCASLNSQNHGMLGEAFFTNAPTDLVLINPARSELVDEAALKRFLARSPQARAYLDVHRQEPFTAGSWDQLPQVFATPHIAGVWADLVPAMIAFEAQLLKDWVKLPREHFLELHHSLLAHERKTQHGWYR